MTSDSAGQCTNCVVAGYITPWLTWLITIPIQVVLILRTLAVWERDAKVAGFLAVLSISYNAIMVVCNIILTTSYHFSRRWFQYRPAKYFCAPGDVPSINTIGVWVTNIIRRDYVLLGSVPSFSKRILVILVRDAFSIASLTMTTILEVPRNSWALMNSVGPALLVVYSVSASHLILNLRKHVDKLESPTGLHSGIHFADSSGLTIMDELNYRSPDVHGSSLVSMEHDNL
ncbi:hypothetical protein BD410DRAFT_873622 [Rickenella mellea]|uniref:Uncharacterized protein n=1 Tax=Rickenella mellea TaxID=50990 RepID=A0A4Y7PXR4_9AGAM|nr:hypothetical protein BD410DRAFT_873622 [Rickenella mellea]